MTKNKFMTSCAIIALSYGVAANQAATAATLEDSIAISISAMSLEEALIEFSRQTGVQVVADADVLRGKRTGGYKQTADAQTALSELLKGTSLTFVAQGKNTVAIVPKSEANSNGARFPVNSDQVAPSSFSAGDENFSLEEIVVTATKRATSLQDTAASITVLGAEELSRKSITSMTDYLNAQPSVTFLDLGAGQNSLVIRGLGISPFEQATVATYFGEVPLTNPLGQTPFSIDFKLVDMERVELLRGPQGTLFGGGSLGGAIRNIANRPNLTELEGQVNASISHTKGASTENVDVSGVLNVPLVEDQLAVRIVAYRESEAGFVDLIETEAVRNASENTGVDLQRERDAGSFSITGLRASSLWQPTEQFDAQLTFATQEIEENGLREVVIPLGGYRNSALSPEVDRLGTNPDGRGSDASMANLVMNYETDWGTFTSSTAYIDTEFFQNADITRLSPGLVSTQQAFETRESWTQELRFASDFEGPLQFIGGLFYEDIDYERSSALIWTGDPDAPFNPFGVTEDPATANLTTTVDTDTAEQFAVFGQFEYQLSSTLMMTAGGRWFTFDRTNGRALATGFFNAGATDPTFELPISENGTNFKFGLDYTPNDDVLLYASFSQGFRLGRGAAGTPDGLKAVCDVNGDNIHDELGIPFNEAGALDSDTTDNYELGGKFTLLDNRVVLNAAVFQVDWTGLPVRQVDSQGNCAIQTNGGTARSRGIEIETRFSLTENLQLNLSGSYIDAEFREGNEPLGLPSGTRLPQSAQWNGAVGLQYEFIFFDNEAFWRSDLAYISDYVSGGPGNLATAIPVGDYAKLDMRAGVNLGPFDLEVFATNLTDENAVTTRFLGVRGWRLNPRTIGINVRRRF